MRVMWSLLSRRLASVILLDIKEMSFWVSSLGSSMERLCIIFCIYIYGYIASQLH